MDHSLLVHRTTLLGSPMSSSPRVAGQRRGRAVFGMADWTSRSTMPALRLPARSRTSTTRGERLFDGVTGRIPAAARTRTVAGGRSDPALRLQLSAREEDIEIEAGGAQIGPDRKGP